MDGPLQEEDAPSTEVYAQKSSEELTFFRRNLASDFPKGSEVVVEVHHILWGGQFLSRHLWAFPDQSGRAPGLVVIFFLPSALEHLELWPLPRWTP